MRLIDEIDFIPLDENNYIILNLVNAACDIISKDTYKKLTKGDFKGLEENVLTALMDRRYLFTSQKAYEEFLKDLNTTLNEQEQKAVPNFLIVPTYACNLRCIYCYEQKYKVSCLKQNNPFKIAEIQLKRIDEILLDYPDIDPSLVKVTLMGGEPLLKGNLETIRYILQQLSLRGFSVNIITNGVDLDYFIDDLIKYNVNYIQVTLDGTKDLHDTRRIDATGKGSFDKIVKNLKNALNKGLSIDLRVNVDQTNVNNLPALAEYIKDNFGKYPKLYPYIYLLQDGGCSGNASILNEEKTIYSILEQEKNNPSMKIFHKLYHGSEFIDSILNNKEFSPILRHCAASKNQYILDARGDVYKCWHGIGDCQNAIGKFDNGWKIDSEKENIWKNRSVLIFEKCKKCKYRYICGSGCPAAEPDENGKFNPNRCRCVDFKNILKALILTNIQAGTSDE